MPKFAGKMFKLDRIANCPVCGAEPIMRKDSTKRFQVWCRCGCKTGWTTKPQAIIDWYNLILAVQAQMPGFDTKENEVISPTHHPEPTIPDNEE